ncbi:hypothetical protein HK100_009648, partial [Physocladia obscura]
MLSSDIGLYCDIDYAGLANVAVERIPITLNGTLVPSRFESDLYLRSLRQMLFM